MLPDHLDRLEGNAERRVRDLDFSPPDEEARRYRARMAQEAKGEVDGDEPGTWVVSVTTNMSMDEGELVDTTEVVENDDGTTTYTKRVPLPRSSDT